jgi:catechol 2,3-dioxygenase-like lactoylglutathione lyase family enzyme
MAIGMTKVLHVKIPVTDLQRSVTWYASLMDLELSKEFIEQGELRGPPRRHPRAVLRLRCGSGSTVPAPRCWKVSTSRHCTWPRARNWRNFVTGASSGASLALRSRIVGRTRRS